ncbi:uncharacterized protein [Littorina saxatilis]|uniref:Uncharacterized protein n=1 Tax=Littorina saxatilis TaxID=31220 RepID=A0AAN9C1H2_9CAEN
MDPRADTTQEGTVHDTSFVPLPHDRSQFTYASSVSEFGGGRTRGHHYNPSASYVDPASQSYFSVPGVRIVEIDPSVQMFPSHPKGSMVTSVLFTFICCFICSIPAVVLSKQAMEYHREGEKQLAASLANQIAFWLILSVIGGVLCWAGFAVIVYAYKF